MGYAYLFGVGLFFAFLDAFGIGANDNANNFANAVASKVVTPVQAVLIAAIFEFAGAVLVGSNVADAIRGRIINVSLFRSNPNLLMLAMVCALMGSSTWILIATRLSLPVSTTHSIIGSIIGVGVAAFGSKVVQWEYGTGRGFAGIIASWFISIAISGLMAAALYLIMKFGVLRYRNSFQRSLVFGPIVFGLTYGVLSLALVWKGTPKLKLDKIPDNDVIAIVLGVWAVSTFLTYLWVSMPLYRYHWVGEDLQTIDYILGPFSPKRPIREGFDTSHQEAVLGKSIFDVELDPAFYEAQEEIRKFNEKAEAEAEEAKKAGLNKAGSGSSSSDSNATTAALTIRDADPESGLDKEHTKPGKPRGASQVQVAAESSEVDVLKTKLAAYEAKENTPRHAWYRKWREDFDSAPFLRKVYLLVQYAACFGIAGREVVEVNDSMVHAKFAPKWENKTEKMYVSLNVITSCIQAFAHGSNDVANAIGPLATIYYVYQYGAIPSKGADVDIWILAFGGASIVLGLALYGYNIMTSLGNNLTYQSPSRGFCMDFGSAVTILIASKEGFPISTTQCITGATIGVGLANGEWRAVNWRLFARILASWAITLPVAGTLAGCIFAFIAYAPSIPHSPADV